MTFLNSVNTGCSFGKQPLFFVAAILLLFTACSDKPDHRDYQVLAEVNGIEITVFEFESDYVEHLIKTGRNDSKEERIRFLNELIDQLVFADAADNRGLLDHPVYEEALHYQQRKSMVDFYFMDQMNEEIEPPTDEEIRLAYAKKQRKVYVRHLFSMREEEVQEAYDQLEEGETFVDVANEFYETEVYDSLAGYLGPINYFGVDDAFAEAAYSTNQGEYTAPIRSRYGYHVIYVEYIEFPAILAEDDYQYRKQGIESQVRLRKQQLVSNNYVRDLMSRLVVEADRDAISDLRDAILGVQSGDIIQEGSGEQESTSDNWDDMMIDELNLDVNPETVLATYVLQGEREEFTVAEYVQWLPYLSLSESKNRTGASVGRGLRNQVLYELADSQNYESDERVEEAVENRGYEILFELYQYELAQEALSDTSEVKVPESFKDRLITDKQVQMKGSYWRIPAEGLSEAESILESIRAGTAPQEFGKYEYVDTRFIPPTDNMYPLIIDAVPGIAVLAHSAFEGWMVLYVDEREVNVLDPATDLTGLERRYRVYDAINSEKERLRNDAEVFIDTDLFDEIYEVWKFRREEGN